MQTRPRLRPVEAILVPDATSGQVLLLRDTQGIADKHAVVPRPLIAIVAQMTGANTVPEIADNTGHDIELVAELVKQLEAAHMLEGNVFEARLRAVKKKFAAATIRPATHAGGAYPIDPAELTKYIDTKCLGAIKPADSPGEMLGLVAPHIDPWRGAAGYGRAYHALSRGLSESAEIFILLGTSHAPMHEPFALTHKSYDTPLGALDVDSESIKKLEAAASFDPYTDELNHKREHSIEFQTVFLQHVLQRLEQKKRRDGRARIVPILAGLGEEQSRRRDPKKKASIHRFIDALRELSEKNPRKVVVIAGADMAHVGPRFGDAAPLDAEARAALETTDRASLDFACARDSESFWNHVASDLDTRRVCGLAPMWTLLEILAPTTRADLLHYEQTIDPEEGSIVSHSALGFYR